MVLQQQAFHLAEQEEPGIHCVPQIVFLIKQLTSPLRRAQLMLFYIRDKSPRVMTCSF